VIFDIVNIDGSHELNLCLEFPDVPPSSTVDGPCDAPAYVRTVELGLINVLLFRPDQTGPGPPGLAELS
jgi:hypothetical protein